MVCKEEVVSWFRESVSHKRLDLMCTLMSMCLPFELRFLGTCLEELGKRDYTELREAEMRANNATEVADAQCVSDKQTRHKLALYLSLLHSANNGCSNVLYKTLANFDLAEMDDDNPLDELLLLYTMALYHPAFTYEQKSVFGNILTKLQDEEMKVSYPQKPALVCMKNMPVSRLITHTVPHVHPTRSHYFVCQPFYMPCTPSPDASSGAAGQHYKPIIPSGESGKAMQLQEMPPGPFFHVAFPNAGGPQASNSVLFCVPPPHGMAQAVGAPNTQSASEYPCPQPSFIMPSMGAELPCQAGMGPVPVNNSLPSAANAEFGSSYRSPCGSPFGSPAASRSGSPGWCSSQQAGAASYKGGTQGTPRHGSSSSSSSCSGGSTSGYRNSRSHPRNKQAHNGQMPSEDASSQHSAEQVQLPNADEHLRGMFANLTVTNGMYCGNLAPRQRMREDKRRWTNPTMTAAPPPNSGSAGSSQSESPSPPRSPPQEEAWESNKDEPQKWEKTQGTMPVTSMTPARAASQVAAPVRGAIGHTVLRRDQDMKQGATSGRRPLHNMPPVPYALYAQGLQPLRASTGAIFQTTPNYMFSSAMMPPPNSGPASFPPFTPNGITSPPPELLYAVPPTSQTSPPPYQVQQFPPAKQTSSPPPFMQYPPTYPPPPVAANDKLTCYNCGGSNHRGADCHEPSIEEVMRKGQYRLDFNTPQSSIDVTLANQQLGGASSAIGSSTSSTSGGNNGSSSGAMSLTDK